MFEYFWSHGDGCPTISLHQLLIRLFRKTKVSQPNSVVIRDKYVSQLEIPVNNLIFMKLSQCRTETPGNDLNRLLLECALFLQILVQISLAAVLEDQIVFSVYFKLFKQLHNILVLDLVQNVDLVGHQLLILHRPSSYLETDILFYFLNCHCCVASSSPIHG